MKKKLTMGTVILALVFGMPMSKADTGHKEIEYEIAAQDQAVEADSMHEEVILEATAYTAADDECGNGDGITASGRPVRPGYVAMSRSIPFGTRVWIEGMGMYEVQDRGGAIEDGKIDIYVETKDEAFEFGRRQIRAKLYY